MILYWINFINIINKSKKYREPNYNNWLHYNNLSKKMFYSCPSFISKIGIASKVRHRIRLLALILPLLLLWWLPLYLFLMCLLLAVFLCILDLHPLGHLVVHLWVLHPPGASVGIFRSSRIVFVNHRLCVVFHRNLNV